MSNLALFVVLYGVSVIPTVLSFWYKQMDVQIGLFLIDLALTIAAYIYLWRAIGAWMLLVLLIGLGFQYILQGFGVVAYEPLRERMIGS